MPKLDYLRDITKDFGTPQRDLKFIHIAGTNGKGSVSIKTQSALSKSGYKTGLYTSPHLFSARERIRVDDEMVTKEKLETYLKDIFSYLERTKKEANFF